jgi:hypothetical protein
MRTVTVLALLTTTACLLVISLTGSLILATAALTAFYICDNVVMVAAEMEMFSTVPPELIGRATGMWRLATGLPSVLAPAAIAVLNSRLGPEAIFVVLAAVCAAPLAWLLTHRKALVVTETEHT